MANWKSELRDGILVVQYDNPPMNYLTGEAFAELVGLVPSWHAEAVRVVVLASAVPGRFITHFDLDGMDAIVGNPAALEAMGTAMSDRFHELILNFLRLPKPIIAAMSGDTMGAGLELCLNCDIRIMERGDYRTGFMETRFSVCPGGGGTQSLTRVIGPAKAIEFLMRGRVADPEQAQALGLVHEVADNALVRAMAVAADLATLAPEALAAVKAAVYGGLDLGLREGLKLEAQQSWQSMHSAKAQDATRAYLALSPDKRRAWIDRQSYRTSLFSPGV